MKNLNTILLPQDFSPSSMAAVPYALDLAHRTGATLHLLYAKVLRRGPDGDDEGGRGGEPRMRERLEAFTRPQALRERGFEEDSISVEHAITRDVAAAPAILNYAEEHDVDLVVLGTHGRRGFRRMLIGSVAEEVVRLAPCPVLTVRSREELEDPSYRPTLESILVPTDFSEPARKSLREARDLAALYGARLELLHVVEEYLHPAFYGPSVQSIYDVEPDIEKKAKQHLKSYFEDVGGPEVDVTYATTTGRAARAIRDYANEKGCQLIVMSTHGRTGLGHFMLGSVTERVIRSARCPVYTVKTKAGTS